VPVITFATRKGGSGKSTAALLLALDLAKSTDVIVIDADPNETILDWADVGKGPERLRTIKGAEGPALRDQIRKASERAKFVIVDTEGTANRGGYDAMMESDLVIVPSKMTYVDAKNAMKTIKACRSASEESGFEIPAYVLWSQVGNIKSRGARSVIDRVEGGSSAMVFRTEITQRGPFETITEHGVALEEIAVAKKESLVAAIKNVESFTDEVIGILRRSKSAQAQSERVKETA
jgi:chromosome partitioning protein